MARLIDFLAKLSFDPATLSEFIANPQASLKKSALAEDEERALTSGVAEALWNVLLGRPSGLDKKPSSEPFTETKEQGTLTVVGTGIRTVGQMTVEAVAWMRAADKVLYLIADPVGEEVIRQLNPGGAMSLRGYYGEGMGRKDSYEAMVQHIVSCVRAGNKTCVAFYGHPGVFAYPAHESIRRLRAEGYSARMLPGVSAEDCLFADLNVDPAVNGCLSIEATDFLLHDKLVDTSSALVLWQVGVVGDATYRTGGYQLGAFPLMLEKLIALYGAAHMVTIYEAATLPGLAPRITPIALCYLTTDYVHAGSTLYIPPARPKSLNRPLATALGFVS